MEEAAVARWVLPTFAYVHEKRVFCMCAARNDKINYFLLHFAAHNILGRKSER